MRLWTEIILEWLNCFDVVETQVNNLKELDDGKFYQKLISLFKWKGAKDILDTKPVIIQFLQDEYPEFKVDYNDLGDKEHEYIASLFLLRVSQEPIFHQPMCMKLQHETQLKIKAFLEMIIPYGKGINRETLREIINELEDNVSRTPRTPKTRALKDFFNSPAARSAHIHKLLNERNYELRKLKSQLEVERFEKSDLQEDLQIQQNKVQSLQKKLQEKAAEIKVLQENKTKQNTPQSCKKSKNTEDNERYYKKEIDYLEDQLMQKQCEVDKLEESNDILTKRLSCMEKKCMYFKEKLENSEQCLENAQMLGELKDRELTNLRMTNEELRMHLEELSKTTTHDHSFEMIDGIATLSTSLNNSEVLSSVIDIQLQEAKEESASLKTQLDTLNKDFKIVTEAYKDTTELLEEKTQILQDTITESSITVNKLKEDIESLQKEKESFIDENKNLQNVCTSQKESLLQIEKSKNNLNIEINSLRGEIETLKESLDDKNVHNTKLNAELAEVKSQIDENLKDIQDLTDQNNLYKTSVELYNKNLKKTILIIEKIDCNEVNNLDNKTTTQLFECLQTSLENFNKKYISNQTELRSLNNLLEETKLKTHNFQSQIVELKEKEEQNITEIASLKETINQNIKEIDKLSNVVKQHFEEIVHLKKVEVQKQNLEKDLYTCKEEINKKVSLLKFSQNCMQTLKADFQNLVTEFHTMKKHTSNQLSDCQKQHKETVNNILSVYKTLYSNYTKEQCLRNKLELELTNNKKELKDSQNLNITLENDLTKSEQLVNSIKLELTDAVDKLTKSTHNLEKLEEMKEMLEVQQKNVQSENEEMLLNLNKTNGELILSQKQVSNISEELKCKDEKIANLIADITSLKLEKAEVLRLKMEEESKFKELIRDLETKLLEKQHCLDQLNTGMKLKQEMLEHEQNKLEKLTADTTISEKKMKEVISNLQEVRSNQDAVLTTQEKALKEKCLIIEQLQKEFSESDSTLRKQLENEKLLCQNLHSTNSKLQIQSYKQMKTIEELQDTLKREKNKLNISEEYSRTQDTKKLQIAQVCESLRDSISDLKSVIVENNPKNENLYADSMYEEPCTDSDDGTENILKIIKNSIKEVRVSRKLILCLSNINTNLDKTLQSQREIINSYAIRHEEYIKHLDNIIKHKYVLQNSLEDVTKSRNDLDTSLSESKQRWDKLLTKYYSIFIMDKSMCNELKCIQDKKARLENTLFKLYNNHYQNVQPVHTILCNKFVWLEHQLKDIYLDPIKAKKIFDTSSDIFYNEKTITEAVLHRNTQLQIDVTEFQEEIHNFSNFVTSFAIEFESDETKFQSETEKKLRLQINQLAEDKRNVEHKLDYVQIQNAKLEIEIEKLKIIINDLKISSSKETDDLKKELLELKKENLKLEEERNELMNRPKKEDVDNQLKDIYDKYKLKLDDIKQSMKAAYNEQIATLNREQEQCIQERLESLQKKMELQCRKQADELSKYKAHVANMSTQMWDIGEKLLSKQKEKEALQKEKEELQKEKEELQRELNALKAKYQNLDEKVHSIKEHKSSKFEKRDLIGENKEEILHKIAIIQEKTTYERRCSIRSIQTMGNAFNAEDEDEVFDNVYLADMKDGNTSSRMDVDRLSILKKRNALCKPHLKSSYPAEMQFHPLPFSEEEIKTGSVDEMFNDSLSQSLLPEQKVKKKDRTQTSYKKPGPPTPSKNGGRLSLQGNELKSPNSKILRERNKERATTTPRTLKSLFISKRQDENTAATPKDRRRSSIFRKSVVQTIGINYRKCNNDENRNCKK